jgi:hypothetical protein
VAESCTIWSSHSRRPVRKLLDTPWYLWWPLLKCVLGADSDACTCHQCSVRKPIIGSLWPVIWQLNFKLRRTSQLSACVILSPTCPIEVPQSPLWEADNYTADREITLLLQNSRFYYSFQKKTPPDPILSQFNLVHNRTSVLILSSHLHLGLPRTFRFRSRD